MSVGLIRVGMRQRPEVEIVGVEPVGPLAPRSLDLRPTAREGSMAPTMLSVSRSCRSKMSSTAPSNLSAQTCVACCPLDQLPGDAQPVCGPPHAALQHIADAEFLGDLADVHRLALVGKGRIPGDDEQAGEFRQAGDQVLDEPVGEILLLRVAAHIGERQHRDRGLLGSANGSALVAAPGVAGAPSHPTRKTRTGRAMFFSVCSPKSSKDEAKPVADLVADRGRRR